MPEAATPLFADSPEDRYWVSSIWGWPHGAAVRMTSAPFPTAPSCSGALVGRRTMVTAAHCFWDPATQSYFPPKAWVVDYVEKWVSSPGGLSHVVQAGFGPVSNCYRATIPDGWREGGTNPTAIREFDYAVVEFDCGYNPGDYTGWVPIGIGGDVDIQQAGVYLEGYDKGAPLPSLNVGSSTYVVGSLLSRSALAGANKIYVSSWPKQIDHYLDATAGSSGSGLLLNLFRDVGDPTFYWSGVHITDDGLLNRARRSDWEAWSFITDGTTEW